MGFLTWPFLLLAVTAILCLPVVRGWPRTLFFLALNLVFVFSYWGLSGTVTALAFCLLGYVCARFVHDRGSAVLALSLGALTAWFIYLRGYRLDTMQAEADPGVGAVMAFAGVSFLFFKIVHVVVDSAGGSIERLPFPHYLNYCVNFTTVLMGPIQRYQDYAQQWQGTPGAASFEACLDSANRILRGLLKAFVLAPYVHAFVLRPGLPIDTLSAGELLLGAYAFYAFLYLDFSGYCDIMIGIGGLMGIQPPENFRFPFLARNVSEYWLRVHRTLTQWLTDYVFTPAYRHALSWPGWFGRGLVPLAASLMLTMLIAGVWHGTTLNFALFGAIHGLALVVVRAYEHTVVRLVGRARFRRFSGNPIVTAAAVLITCNFTALAYTFFVMSANDSLRVFVRLGKTATGWLA